MKDKEIIEEIKKYCCWFKKGKCLANCGVEDICDLNCGFGQGMETLIEQGYRKINKDSVVLSREEYETYKELDMFLDGKSWDSIIKDKCKETAKKILNELYMHFSADKLCGILNPNKNYNSAKVVSRLAKQCGIGIKE